MYDGGGGRLYHGDCIVLCERRKGGKEIETSESMMRFGNRETEEEGRMCRFSFLFFFVLGEEWGKLFLTSGDLWPRMFSLFPNLHHNLKYFCR